MAKYDDQLTDWMRLDLYRDTRWGLIPNGEYLAHLALTMGRPTTVRRKEGQGGYIWIALFEVQKSQT